LINLNSSTPTTIATLAALTAPSPIPANNRVQPTETTVWLLNATLTQYKLESDSDYHLVLSDGSGHSMIVEIPAPSCVGSGSPLLSGIQNARSEFDARFTATTSFQTANIPVQVKGVGMFDFLHGQTGVAPNGIELHAVLDIIFNPTSNFSISASPSSLAVVQGNSGSTSISISVSGGFNSAVSLSATGLPSGVTASFNPTSIAAPGSGTSTMALNVGASTAPGTYSITVTGSGGGTTHTTTVSLTVNTATTPDFAISSSPGSISVIQGSSGTSTISTTVSGGFNSAVSLSASGAPTGVTASFSPTSIAAPGSGSSTMTLTVGASATAGTYPITVTATGGGKTHTANVSLTVTASGGGGGSQQLLGNPGFENGSSTPAPWTVSTGVISNSTSQPPHSGSWDAWLDGYGTATTDTLLQQVAIPSTATAATLSFWLHIDTAETTTTTAYDTLKVQVRNSSGTVLATLATYSNLNAAAGYSQKSFDLTSYKGQTIQIYLIGVEDSQKQTSFVMDDFALNVTTGSSTELISNNGFEGTLSPWILGGVKVPIVSTARIHTGADSMRLGATSASGSTEPNGDSSAYQSVTIPANATTATLTFWYSTYTTDTIQYDWQEAQIQDSNGATLLQVFKLAANNTAWTQQTVDLKPYAGRTIKIYFNCHGDGATDPTTLYVDDVSVQVTQ
jgi:hypothetical protein